LIPQYPHRGGGYDPSLFQRVPVVIEKGKAVTTAQITPIGEPVIPAGYYLVKKEVFDPLAARALKPLAEEYVTTAEFKEWAAARPIQIDIFGGLGDIGKGIADFLKSPVVWLIAGGLGLALILGMTKK